MSWASSASASRLEGMAYALLGIFDTHVPILYGEWHKAFSRLEKEITKGADGHFLFIGE